MAKRDSFFIVGIGSSAGGLEALQLFLKNAPCRENLAYVIAQHLSPTHKSMLTDLLSKSSKLKTIEAQNGMAIEGGSLYVTPPNKDIKVANNIIHLLAPSGESYAAKPSINNLFRSLAYSSDSKPIGILLSGTGSDGTQGLMAIKEAGGITIVQDPKSAKYDGMPHSAIVARAADIILIPEKIGYELELIMDNFIDGTTLPMQNRGISDYSTIIEIIYKTLGIDFSGYKKNTIQRRIQRRMTTKKLNSVAQYVDYLNQNSSEVKALFQDILIGVTEFFRDKESFDALRDEIQQYIINKSEDGYLRVWIVGVSSGEEAYSIAILLKELILEHSLELTMQIFATDMDDVAISKARKGEYELTQIQNITDKDCKKYFNISDSKAHLKREVRDSVIFSKHNIITDPPFNKLDLIVCRNLLIYFESELQKKVISTFHYALKDSGILFLGKSETIGQLHYLFSPLSNTHKIFKRELSGESMRNQFLFRQQSPTQKERKPQDQLPKKSLDEQLIQSIGEHFMPKSLLVNGALDIIYLKDKIPYLDIPAGHTTLNIFKTIIPELSLELRTLIHKAKKTNGFCSGSFHKLKANNKQIMLKISVLPFAKDSSEGSTFFIINFQEENIKDFRATEPKDIETKNSEALNALQDELTRTKVHLQAVIEELETSNEELQSTNEELQSSNEELQSTNEELETSNEEHRVQMRSFKQHIQS
ncbi:MAG: CheR family methyltransferase [Campylobacterales bacterium]